MVARSPMVEPSAIPTEHSSPPGTPGRPGGRPCERPTHTLHKDAHGQNT